MDLLPFFCPLFSALIHKVLEDGQGIHTVFRVGDRTGHTLRMPLDSPDGKAYVLHSFHDGMAVGIGPGHQPSDPFPGPLKPGGGSC